MVARECVDLVQYLADFDLSLWDLRPEQTAMFVAARNAAGYVEEMQIPMASDLPGETDATLGPHDTHEILEETVYANERIEAKLPTDEMKIGMIRSIADLSHILPTQWMMEDICPDVFYAKLAQRDLLMPEWYQPSRDCQDGCGEVPECELVDRQVSSRSWQQHAYLLLDTSRTMRDRDRRGTVARGLALAFLRQGYVQRARLNLRPFTVEVGELSSGVTSDDFHAIVRRVIDLPNSGQTRIQNALERAVRDIRDAGPCRRADIMLITDGISWLAKSPLDGEVLHTFLVGDPMQQTDTAPTRATLREWSRTFRRVWENRFAGLLAPTPDDLVAADRLLQSLLKELGENPTDEIAEHARQVLANVKSLLDEFRRCGEKDAPVAAEVQDLDPQLSAAEDWLAALARERSNLPPNQPAPSGRQSMQGSIRLSGAGETLGDWSLNWRTLRELLASVWRWIRARPE